MSSSQGRENWRSSWVEVNTLDAVSGQQSADAVEVCENVFISEQTVTCPTYSVNRLVFITELKNAYCAV